MRNKIPYDDEITEGIRDVTPEERELTDKYIKSISKPTGIDFNSLFIHHLTDKAYLELCSFAKKGREALYTLKQIKQIINAPVNIQEDVIRYKMICEVIEKMDRLISEKEVDKVIMNYYAFDYRIEEVLDAIKAISSAEPNTGHWIHIDDVMSVFDDFMCGEVDKEGTDTFLEMLEDKVKQYPQEPKNGYWIDADGDNAICGCCNRLNHLYGTYCKHCGARMIEPQESEEI